jgi:hypothetical protein
VDAAQKAKRQKNSAGGFSPPAGEYHGKLANSVAR